MITHNEVTAGLWLVVAISSGTVGLLIGRLRPSRQVLSDEHDYGYERGYDDGYDRGWDAAEARRRLKDQYLPDTGRRQFDYDYSVTRRDTGELTLVSPRRHAVVLEPGQTYPGLVALAGDALDGPESHAEPITSTWLRGVLLDLERRYPIPLDSPNGRIAEAI